MAADVRQIQRILEGGIAAARHRRILAGVKGAVTHCAEGDAGEAVLPRQTQGAVLHPGGQDQHAI